MFLTLRPIYASRYGQHWQPATPDALQINQYGKQPFRLIPTEAGFSVQMQTLDNRFIPAAVVEDWHEVAFIPSECVGAVDPDLVEDGRYKGKSRPTYDAGVGALAD